jgi:hypothetical protein
LIYRNSAEKKEFVSMARHRTRFLTLALVALIGLAATETRAASITITIVLGNSDVINVGTFTTGGTATSYGTVNLTTLNAKLYSDGSEYQFSGLGGGSNNPGSTQGLLTLTGGIEIIPGSGHTGTGLTITETEGGFTSPSGTSGTLLSSSSATFANQAAGAGQTASSEYNTAPTAGPYNVFSTGLNPNSPGNSSSAPITAFVTPYSLTNTLSIGLTPSSATVTDQFGVTGTVVATAIPEPASLVMFLSGMPVPLAILVLLRRRRAATAA